MSGATPRPGGELALYDEAVRAIAAARRTDEAVKIRNKADAMRAYAKQAKNKALELDAAEIRMRAERQIGHLMKAQRESVGTAKPGPKPAGGAAEIGSEMDPISMSPATLKEAGIDKHLADKARRLAALPADEFETRLGEWRRGIEGAHDRVTTTLLKQASRARARDVYESRIKDGGSVADLDELVRAGRRFPVLYADPPWQFESYSDKGTDRSAEAHYATMPLAQIAALPVAKIGADDCTLFLWATGPMLEAALGLIDAWGFTYKATGFTWIKQNADGSLFTGQGFWTRSNPEFCLLATRGKPSRDAADVHSVIMAPVGRHSAKPEETRRRIERLVPGPYLELFARQPVDGWVVWGNEVAPPTVEETA